MYVVKYSENLSYYTLVIGISYNFSEKKAFNENNTHVYSSMYMKNGLFLFATVRVFIPCFDVNNDGSW